MKYKMMAVDIDGTLLDSQNRLTGEVKHAIRLAVSKGLIFTICTGRPIQGVEPLIDEIGLDIPFITYNGAMVVMGKSRQIIYEQNLTSEDSMRIMELGNMFGTTIIVWVKNKLYVNRLDERAEMYARSINFHPVVIDNPENLLKDGATKILFYDTVERIHEYESKAGQYVGNMVNYHTSKPMYLEFVDKNASKAIALQKMGEYYGISREEIIAVGDGENDLSMIKFAGLGVAMANAEEEIRKAADFVTLSNDENGVAYVINRFVLKNS